MRFRAGKRLWEAGDDALLRRLYPDTSTAQVAKQLGCSLAETYKRAHKLGLAKSAAYLASPDAYRFRRGYRAGWEHRFGKGHVPANKGLRRPGWGSGRMKETQFKLGVRKGMAAKNWRPVGTILTDGEGYQHIKVREAQRGEACGFGNMRVWPLLQRYVWTQARGPIPKGYTVCFQDGDRANCDLSNLELVSRRDLMKRNSVHNYPKPIAEAVQLIGAVNRHIHQKERHAK